MDLNEFKKKLLDTGLFRKVSGDGQYRCKTCPFCGDMKGHMYVKILFDDDTPVMYNCFKCNAHGFMNEKFLSYFGFEDIQIPRSKGYKRIQPNHVSTSTEALFDDVTDAYTIQEAMAYICSRVGVHPTMEDLHAFQVIGNPEGYVRSYLGTDISRIPGRVWFRLTNGNIAGRSIKGSGWLKYNSNRVSDSANMYMIKQMIDTYQPINVCICEGVMDAIGLYMYDHASFGEDHNKNMNNAVYIACLGRNYIGALKHILGLGIFGDSVHVRFYLDSDISETPKIPKFYQMLFKSVGFYRNTLAKDYGYPASMIAIEKIL